AVVRCEHLVNAVGLAAESVGLLRIVAAPDVDAGTRRGALPAEHEADAVDAHANDVGRRRNAADDAIVPQHLARRAGDGRQGEHSEADNERRRPHGRTIPAAPRYGLPCLENPTNRWALPDIPQCAGTREPSGFR